MSATGAGSTGRGWTNWSGYLFFLPTLVVGPIHRFGEYHRDLYRVRLEGRAIGEGLERILHGYVKIGFLANYLVGGKLGGWMAELPAEAGALRTYLWIVQGGLNLYFQFSGFSDVAIGFARLLGFRVMENFAWPYLQPNISAYWRSWHISLTGWCRDYVYSAVVSATRSPALRAMMTLLAIGLWHELSPSTRQAKRFPPRMTIPAAWGSMMAASRDGFLGIEKLCADE